jgi:hypothetical protein
VRCDATALLAKSRGYRDHHEPLVHCRVAWTDGGQRRARTVPLQVTTTPQPLGVSVAGGDAPCAVDDAVYSWPLPRRRPLGAACA